MSRFFTFFANGGFILHFILCILFQCLGIKGIVNKIHSHGDVFVEFINGQE